MGGGGDDVLIFLYLERPPSRGQNLEKLQWVACKRVPVAVSAMIHPGTCQPRKNIVGRAHDPGRKGLMWQDRENGPGRWQVPSCLFWQE